MRCNASSVRRVRPRGAATTAERSAWNLFIRARNTSPECRLPMAIRSVRHSLMISADRKSTLLNSSHLVISYAVFCLKKKKHSWLPVPQWVTSSAYVYDEETSTNLDGVVDQSLQPVPVPRDPG